MQALIWDVDGTLAETERDGHRVAFNAAFQALGLPWRWNEARYGELLAVNGGRERLLHDMASQAEAPRDGAERDQLARRLHRLKNEAYADIVATGCIPLRPGVAALMDDCLRAGLPMAIATTTSRRNVDALLTVHLGPAWASRFAAIACAEDAPVKKPDPQVYHRALQWLGLPAKAALAIEDAPVGLRACQAAGVAVVITRSAYFADLDTTGALAVGPGLGSVGGWHPESGELHGDARVDLPRLRQWFGSRPAAPSGASASNRQP